ncbi:MAG: Gmad2 immunoglobulin-like domain-containing protein [bacterium]
MKKLILVLILVVLLVSLWFLFENQNNEKRNEDGNGRSDAVEKIQYEDSDYSFSLEYPETWQEFISDEEITPKFNFYPNNDDLNSEELPFDHFVNETHVSVYPEGIPTEGIFGQSISVEESGIEFPYELKADSKVYVLENGEPFAIYLKPLESPDNWNSSGFVFARVKVDNLETTCKRDGQVISEQEGCDPLVLGDQIIRNGDIDTKLWVDVVETVESFGFTSEISNKNDSDSDDDFAQNEDIIVDSPQPDQIISSPLELEGEVRGNWLFEATAPVVLTDWDGEIIAESYIETDQNWMTTDFVSFSGSIEFEAPEDIGDFSDKGTIIFQKSNPSGLPENDDALEFDVLFR